MESGLLTTSVIELPVVGVAAKELAGRAAHIHRQVGSEPGKSDGSFAAHPICSNKKEAGHCSVMKKLHAYSEWIPNIRQIPYLPGGKVAFNHPGLDDFSHCIIRPMLRESGFGNAIALDFGNSARSSINLGANKDSCLGMEGRRRYG